jgi:hypothetical protein
MKCVLRFIVWMELLAIKAEAVEGHEEEARSGEKA